MAEFRRLAIAGGAEMCDPFAHRFESGPGAHESLWVAADHNRYCPFDRPLLAAGARGVKPEQAFRPGLFGQFARDLRRDRAHVDDDRAGLRRGEYALVAPSDGRAL